MWFQSKAPKCTCGGKTKPIGKQTAPSGQVIRLFHCRGCDSGTFVPEGSELVGRIKSFECCDQPRQYLGGDNSAHCFTCDVCGIPRAVDLEPETLPSKIEPCNCQGCSTEFHRAIHSLAYPVVGNLIKSCPGSLNASCEFGWTLLHHAVLKTDDMVSELAAAGCDVNARDSYGRTPLHTAVLARVNDYSDIPAILLLHGADPSLTDHQGQTPLELARAKEVQVVVEQIEEHSANALPRRFLFAAYHGNSQLVRDLLKSDPGLVKVSLCYGATALHLAAQQGHVQVAKLLIDHGAPAQANADNSMGRILPTVIFDGNERDGTPLGLAIQHKRREVEKMLRECGIQPAPIKKRVVTINCPECQKEYTVRREFFGKRSKCVCGYQIEFPEPVWLDEDRRKYVRSDLKSIQNWKIADASELRGMLVFFCQLLPQVSQETVVQHYKSLIDPMTVSSVGECVDELIKHLNVRSQSGRLWCLRWCEQCFVEGTDELHWVKVQVRADDFPSGEPFYLIFRTGYSEFLLDRPRWNNG